MAKEKCKSCGVKWTEHSGIHPTCAALQTALKTLRQISTMPRQRRARQLASATIAFLETQTATIKRA